MRFIYSIFLTAVCCSFTFNSSAQNVVKDTLEFDKASARTPAELIRGRISGVQVTPVDGNINGAVNTLIRGVNSLRSDSQPLWVIDGVFVNPSLNQNNKAFYQYGEKSFTSPLNTMAFLNAYDIESIEVVKDLSEAGKYGINGGNGVILVTTKLPDQNGFRVKWDSNFSLGVPEGNSEAERLAFSHNHYVNVSHTNGQTLYSIAGYFRQNSGVMKRNDSMYGGLRAIFDTKANSVVWFGMNTAIALGRSNSVTGTSYFGAPSLTMSVRNRNFFPDDSISGWLEDYDDSAQDRRLTNSLYLTLNFLPNLSLRTTLGIDFQNMNRSIWYGNGTSFGKDNNGAASMIGSTFFNYNAESVLSWKVYAGKDHLFSLKAAATVNGNMTKFNTINGTDFYSHSLRAQGLNLKASQPITHKYDNNYLTHGGYLDFAYDYKDITGLSVNLRADRTPRYDDGHFNLYKSANAYLDLHNLFFRDSKAFSSACLKVGYGEAGREQYVPRGLYGEYISGAFPRTETKYEMFYEGLNRNSSAEFNAGIDLGFISDRIKLHFAYYDKYTQDAFFSYCFAEQTGRFWEYGSRKDEFSQASVFGNRGLETDMDFAIVRSGDWTWNLSANAAYNINQVLKIDVNDARGRAVGEGVIANANVDGYPIGALWGYKLDQSGSLVDVTKDGYLNDFDKLVIGNPNPKVFGGISSTLTFRNFTLDLIANGAAGFDVLNLNRLLFSEPKPYRISEAYVEKGDYLNLSRVSFKYRVPLKKLNWLQSMSVGLSGMNLCTLTAYSGYDPNVNCFGTTYLSSGIDYGSYPVFRTFLFNLELNF